MLTREQVERMRETDKLRYKYGIEANDDRALLLADRDELTKLPTQALGHVDNLLFELEETWAERDPGHLVTPEVEAASEWVELARKTLEEAKP